MGLCFGGSESTVVDIEQKQFVEKCFFVSEYDIYIFFSQFVLGMVPNFQ